MHCIAHHPRTLTPRQTRAHNKTDINKHAWQTHIPTIYDNKGSEQKQQAAMNEDDQCKNTKTKRPIHILSPQLAEPWKVSGHKMDHTNSARPNPSPPLHSTPAESSRCWVDVESSPLALLWNSPFRLDCQSVHRFVHLPFLALRPPTQRTGQA